MATPAPAPPIAPEPLSDGVVTLRAWAAGDAPALYEAARESIDTVSPWLPWLDADYRPEDADHWVSESAGHWQRGTDFRFAIWHGADGRLLGGVGINQLNLAHRCGNLGYWVRTSATRAGVATRAARLVARFGLTTADLGRIEILTATDNLASQRVADRIGATFEGVLRDRLFVRGEWIPARLYSLVRSDLSPGVIPASPATS